jgi:hypothetical protein
MGFLFRKGTDFTLRQRKPRQYLITGLSVLLHRLHQCEILYLPARRQHPRQRLISPARVAQQRDVRFVFTLIEFESVRFQVLLQRANEMYKMLRHIAGCCIHDVVMSPVTRLVEAELEDFTASFPGSQLQSFEPGLLYISDENQGAMQCIVLHRSPAAKVMQGSQPQGQLFALGVSRPQREKYFYLRAVGVMAHKPIFYPYDKDGRVPYCIRVKCAACRA